MPGCCNCIRISISLRSIWRWNSLLRRWGHRAFKRYHRPKCLDLKSWWVAVSFRRLTSVNLRLTCSTSSSAKPEKELSRLMLLDGSFVLTVNCLYKWEGFLHGNGSDNLWDFSDILLKTGLEQQVLLWSKLPRRMYRCCSSWEEGLTGM